MSKATLRKVVSRHGSGADQPLGTDVSLRRGGQHPGGGLMRRVPGHTLRPWLAFAAALSMTTACGRPPVGHSAPPALPPGAVADHREVVYEVAGDTREELLRDMRVKGPRVEGRSTWGRHEWSLRWSFRYAPSEGRCRMTDVRAELHSTTTLPRWIQRDQGDAALVESWDAMMAALRVHENGHRDIAYRATRDVLRTLRRTTDARCGFLGARANARAERIPERYRSLNREYDAETRSGLLQGVTLADDGVAPAPDPGMP